MNGIKLLLHYMRDREVSIYKKVLIIGSLFYFLLPFDLVPDYIIGIGWLDDLLVAIFIYTALRVELNHYKERQISRDHHQHKDVHDHKVIELQSKKKEE